MNRPTHEDLFELEELPDGKYRTKILDLRLLSEVIGGEALLFFVVLFSGIDRLLAVLRWAFELRNRPEDSMTVDKDRMHVFVITCGVLIEIVNVINKAKDKTIITSLLDCPSWRKLDADRKAVETNPLYFKFRNKIGFHFDIDICSSGLNKMLKKCGEVVLSESDSKSILETSLPMGTDAIIQGLSDVEGEDFNEKGFSKFVEDLNIKQQGFPIHATELFIEYVDNSLARDP